MDKNLPQKTLTQTETLELIATHFTLSDVQIKQFEQIGGLYREWNEKVNVISRKDIDSLYEHHILHSLALLKVIQFKDGSKIMDLGSGGGFPGIPLAIMLPEVSFLLVDSVGKKMNVAQSIANELGLKNVITKHSRAEDIQEKFDFVVTRAVASLPNLFNWTKNKFLSSHKNAYPNGLFAYKGGDVWREELLLLKKNTYSEYFSIHDKLPVDYFSDKYIVYMNF